MREALRTLELLGIVETRAGGGTFVRQMSPDDLARPLTSLMSRGHSLADVIEFRGLIEPAIAALAAERITQPQLTELAEIFAAQERKIAAGEPYADEDTRFHEIIGEASRNELLTTMLGVIWDVMRESREQWLQTNQRAHSGPRETSSTCSYGWKNSMPRCSTTASQNHSMSSWLRAINARQFGIPCSRMKAVARARSTAPAGGCQM